MITTLSHLYPLDPKLVARIDELRRRVNGGLFALKRKCPR